MRLRRSVAGLVALTATMVVVAAQSASSASGFGVTSRVSVASDGRQGNADSQSFEPPAMSADGRFVAFTSFASNLVAGDTNAAGDVFVRNRLAGVTRRVSVGAGGQANGGHPRAAACCRPGSPQPEPGPGQRACPAAGLGAAGGARPGSGRGVRSGDWRPARVPQPGRVPWGSVAGCAGGRRRGRPVKGIISGGRGAPVVVPVPDCTRRSRGITRGA